MKRIFDILAAAAGLVLLGPLLLLIFFLVRFGLGKPALFCQTRPGMDGKPFKILKFRSMNNKRGPDGNLLPDKFRLTQLGRFLRATSLDELPELFNVLKGDMSIVGPRPLLMKYLPLYSPEQMRRHEVRPGITGWAQINGRNAISWEEKFKLDLWYVDNRSFWLDIKIILLTLLRTIKREGINEPGQETAREFKGNGQQ